jgi:glycosyltransferase involved in cell wall biosynthesis
MAMEMPVVVTGSGGVKELVDDGIDGLLVEPQSPEELADAISYS